MADQAALLLALSSFATRSVHDYDLQAVVNEVTRHAINVLGLDGAGITLSVSAPGSSTQYIAASDARTLHVEREQDRLQQGACVDAISAAAPVYVSDIAAVDRWPEYKPAVLELGFRGVAGIPMLADQRVVGALNAYTIAPREWTDDDLSAAVLLADIATAYIVNAAGYADQAALSSRLQHALDTRLIIEQAKGVLAERHGVTPEQAFEAIREHSCNQRAELHEIAADVLANRQQIDP